MYWSLENVPWTNLHDLNLDWVINTMKQTVEQWIAYRAEMNQKYQDFTDNIELWKEEVENNFAELQQYVQDYFDNLDLNESTRYVINQMIASGEFIEVLNPSIVTAVESWLASHITPTTPAVDNTLTVSGAAADAKVTGDRITALEPAKLELTASNSPTIPDNSDFDSYTTPGTYKITSNSHAQTMTNCPVPNAGKLIVIELGQPLRLLQLYITSNISTNATIWGRYYGGSEWNAWQYYPQGNQITNIINRFSGELSTKFETDIEHSTVIPDNSDINTYRTPGTYIITNNTHAATMTNLPLNIAGKLIVINITSSNSLTQWYIFNNAETNARVWTRYYINGTWTNWQYNLQSTNFNNVADTVKKLAKTFMIGYSTGSYGDATERLHIFCPTTTGYIVYRFYKFVVPNIKCDVWQLYAILPATDAFSIGTSFTIPGEMEMALKLDGRSDFSGGHTHGDEITTSFIMIVDNKIVNPSEYKNTRMPANDIKMIRVSNIYDPDNETQIIAEHGVEYHFHNNTLTINQSVNWKVAEQLDNCFLAMFTPSKNYIDRAIANCDFETMQLPTTTTQTFETIVKHDVSMVTMFDTESRFTATLTVYDYPKNLPGGDQISLSDNGGLDYNKLYFKVCGSGTSAIGELWKSSVEYKFGYSES